MRHLRVFDNRRTLLFDLRHVVNTRIPQSGALVIDLEDPAPEQPEKLVLAHGYWAAVQEFTEDDEQLPEDAEQAMVPDHPFNELRSVPMVPGMGTYLAAISAQLRPTGGAPAAELPPLGIYATDKDRVHRAMQIVCQCNALRCPVVLNAATDAERRTARIRHKLMLTRVPLQATPYMQCSHEAGHDPIAEPHQWTEGGWPYGPAQHHPDCPRHPSRYNVPAGEGQPPAVLTPAPTDLSATRDLSPSAQRAIALASLAEVEQMAEVFARHAEPDQAFFAVADGMQPPAATDRRTCVDPGEQEHDHAMCEDVVAEERELVRPFVSGSYPVISDEVDPGNSGPGWPRQLPVRKSYNESQRSMWNVCAEYAPDNYAKQLWCELAVDHKTVDPDSLHESTQGGDRIRW